jgi:hypothetical protein
MYPPREPNARMNLEDVPGRSSELLHHPSTTVFYNASETPGPDETAQDNNGHLKSWAYHSAVEPTRLRGTLSVRKP